MLVQIQGNNAGGSPFSKGVGYARPGDQFVRNGNNGNNNGNGHGKDDDNDSMPEFLTDGELPGELVGNPSQTVGVDFKAGKKPKSQKLPGFANKKSVIIRGLDNKPIKLDLESSERVNVYHPDQYTLSDDGTHVTDNETGEVIQLTTFFATDKKNNFEVMYSLDEQGYLNYARVTPKGSDEEGPESEEDFELEMERKGAIQNFQLLDGTDILVGYEDDDIDLTNAPSFGDVEMPEDVTESGDDMEDEVNGERRRRMQRTDAVTAYGKTCYAWDFLTVRITTDRKFR